MSNPFFDPNEDISIDDSGRLVSNPSKLQTIKVEAEFMTVRIGTLAVEFNALGFGSVLLDGKPVKCRSLSIKSVPGKVAEIILEVLPL